MELRRKTGVIRNQLEGLLEEGGIKLAAVASDIFGVSGWAMLERIAQGETDAAALAMEARATKEEE